MKDATRYNWPNDQRSMRKIFTAVRTKSTSAVQRTFRSSQRMPTQRSAMA
jgi:hypothetical protein